MRIPHRHLSRREAERLLDDPAAHRSALGTLLAAAGAPARPDELGREDATAAAFHRTAMVPSAGGSHVPVPAPRRGGRAATRAVVATGAVVALASGGLALAGSADLPHIPGLPGQASDQATESVAKTPKSSEASSSSTTPEGQATVTGGPGAGASGKPGSPTSAPTSAPGPAPSLEGLCRAFQAMDHAANGASLDSAAFAALAAAATAAGDADVATYCVDLIGEPRPNGRPSALPTPTSKPTSSRPSGTPSGKPSVLPTPTSKPTPTPPAGKPSSAPGKPADQPSPADRGGGRKS